MDVLLTPSDEMEPILSLLAASKLRLDLDVALAGELRAYWDAKRFYGRMGLLSRPRVVVLLEALRSEGISRALSKASMLDRAASTIQEPSISIETPPEYEGIPSAGPERSEGPK